MTYIPVVCPSCAAKMRAPESAAGRKTKCPKCGATLVVPNPSVKSAHDVPPSQPVTSSVPTPEPASVRQPEDFDIAIRLAQLAPQARGELPCESVPSAVLRFQQLDIYTKIAAGAALVGLLVLGVSPLFRWINIANGGVIGLKVNQEGKIVFSITLVVVAVWIAVLIKPKWFKAGAVAVQAWGTIAVFWMAALIWKVGAIFESPDNPFAGLLATLISPGVGLYIGLIGSLLVTVALGFITAHRSGEFVGGFRPFFTIQGISIAIGILLTFFVGPSGSVNREDDQAKAPNLSWLFADAKTATKAKIDAKWADSTKGAVRQGDLQVQIIQATISDVLFKTIRGYSMTPDKVLMIKLELLNVNATKKVDYHPWSGKHTALDPGYATLKDNFGNSYKLISLGVGSYPIGAVVGVEAIYPNKSVTDVLVFEAPLDTATHLYLELPAVNYGSEGIVRFRIPINAVSRE